MKLLTASVKIILLGLICSSVLFTISSCKKKSTDDPAKKEDQTVCRLDSTSGKSWDASGKLQSDGHTIYTYDVNGNLTNVFSEDYLSWITNNKPYAYSSGKLTKIGGFQDYALIEYSGTKISGYKSYLSASLFVIVSFKYTGEKLTNVVQRHSNGAFNVQYFITWDGDNISKVEAKDSTNTKVYETIDNIVYADKQNPRATITPTLYYGSVNDGFRFISLLSKNYMTDYKYVLNGAVQDKATVTRTYDGYRLSKSESVNKWGETGKTNYYYKCN